MVEIWTVVGENQHTREPGTRLNPLINVNTNCLTKEEFCQPNYHLVQACRETCNFRIPTINFICNNTKPLRFTNAFIWRHRSGALGRRTAVTPPSHLSSMRGIKEGFSGINDRYRYSERPDQSEQRRHCGAQVRCHLRTQTFINRSVCVCVFVPLWIGRQGGFHGVEGVHRMNGGIIRVPPTVLERQP